MPQTSWRLCVLARPLNNAARTTPPLDEPSTARATASRTSRRAAEPQSRLSEPSTARETALQLAPSRQGAKSFAGLRAVSPRRPEAPPSSPRLCASARPLNNAAHTTPPLDEPSTARATVSRTSRQAAHVGDTQAVGIGAGHPAHLCVSASVGDTADLLAPLRLCATLKQRRPHHPSSRRALDGPRDGVSDLAQSRRAAEPTLRALDGTRDGASARAKPQRRQELRRAAGPLA
jgi:hypothetical protein